MTRLSASYQQRCEGFTLVELLIGLVLAGIFFSATLTFFSDVSWRARDTGILLTTWKEARHVISLMASEVRLAGSGVPFSQSGFAPGTAGLGDKPLSVLTTSTASRVTFRAARRGALRTVTTDYTPSSVNLTISINSSTGFAVGDEIYLSNLPRGGTGGLWGTITAVNTNQVTIRNDYIVSTGATFEAGSTIQPVETITYESPNYTTGIVRTDSHGTLTLVSEASISVEYLDKNLATLSLPLTAGVVGSQLAAVRVTFTMSPRQRIKIKPNYTTQITQTITIRNLLI